MKSIVADNHACVYPGWKARTRFERRGLRLRSKRRARAPHLCHERTLQSLRATLVQPADET